MISNSEDLFFFQKLMGESRQKYLDQLQERLRNRQRKIDNGEDPDDDDEGLEEIVEPTTGNILRDLDRRYDDEKDALLRKLRVRVCFNDCFIFKCLILRSKEILIPNIDAYDDNNAFIS